MASGRQRLPGSLLLSLLRAFLSRYDPREVACLIADIRMHGMTGLELQDKLLERNSPLPIVFITGHGDVPMAVETMKKGALDFIQKPSTKTRCVGVVERMLERARDAPSPTSSKRPARDAPAGQADRAAKPRCWSASSPGA